LQVDAASFTVEATRITAVPPQAAVNGFGPMRIKPQGQPAKFTTNSFRTLSARARTGSAKPAESVGR
jgi:hypothetical protein